MPVSGNFWLNRSQMEENAQYIYDTLYPSWTLNAICGMLGNMQTESTINPGIWQDLKQGNTKLGFGLVQWTPATKYIEWAQERGYETEAEWADMDLELERIQWEVENNVQWAKTSAYPITFRQFTQSNADPYTLGLAFLKNYERPKNPNQPIRGKQAQEWYAFLSGGEPTPPVNPPSGWGTARKSKGFPIWLLANVRR